MRLLFCAAVLLALTVGALAKDEENKMLLGADDVDKKHAEMAESDSVNPTEVHTVKEAKKMVKDDKRELKELQDRARALKEQLRDSKQLSKSDKKALKQNFRAAKESLRTKKHEIHILKSEIKELKSGKRPPVLDPTEDKKGGRRKTKGGKKRKNKLQLIGAEEERLNKPESMGLHSDIAVDEPVLSKKEQRKLMKKMSRKSGRKQHKRKNKKNGNTAMLDMLDTEDKPQLRSALEFVPNRPHNKSDRKHNKARKGRRGRRIPCTTDADCHNGAMCFENRKGHKFCKGNGMDKTAGKKCHRSEQCARGLMCFVRNTDVGTGKHHKKKGICADPTTADQTKGSFLPFQTSK